MKKILFLAMTALWMITAAAFAREVISDGELDGVTAEQGVSIDLSHVTVATLMDSTTISWGDSDGDDGSYNSTGFMGLTAVNFSNTATGGNVVSFGGPMKFDVGTSGVRTALTVQLPTVTVGGNMDATMKLGTGPLLTGANVLGHLKMDGFSTQIKSDYIAVFAH